MPAGVDGVSCILLIFVVRTKYLLFATSNGFVALGS